MKRTGIVSLALGAALAASPAMAGNWAGIASLAEARYGAATAGLDSSAYVLGGHSVADLATASVWSHAGGWSETTALPGTRIFAAAASLGGNAFAFGGFDSNG